MNSRSLSPIPTGVKAEIGSTKSEGEIKLILICGLHWGPGFWLRWFPGGRQAYISHWVDSNGLAQGKSHRVGVPG